MGVLHLKVQARRLIISLFVQKKRINGGKGQCLLCSLIIMLSKSFPLDSISHLQSYYCALPQVTHRFINALEPQPSSQNKAELEKCCAWQKGCQKSGDQNTSSCPPQVFLWGRIMLLVFVSFHFNKSESAPRLFKSGPIRVLFFIIFRIYTLTYS